MPVAHLKAVMFKLADASRPQLDLITQRNPETGAVEQVANPDYDPSVDTNSAQNVEARKQEAAQKLYDSQSWWEHQGGTDGIAKRLQNFSHRAATGVTREGLNLTSVGMLANTRGWLARGKGWFDANRDWAYNKIRTGNAQGAKYYEYHPAEKYKREESTVTPAEAGGGAAILEGVGRWGQDTVNNWGNGFESLVAPVMKNKQDTLIDADQGYWSANGEHQTPGAQPAPKPPKAPAFKPQNSASKPVAVPPPGGPLTKGSGWQDFVGRRVAEGSDWGGLRDVLPEEDLTDGTETLWGNLKKVPREMMFGRERGIMRALPFNLMATPNMAAGFVSSVAPPTAGGWQALAQGKPWREGFRKYVARPNEDGTTQAGNTFKDWWKQRFGDPETNANARSATGYEFLRGIAEPVVNIAQQGKKFFGY